ncbi:hypothetical protein [Streptomyces nodosus]
MHTLPSGPGFYFMAGLACAVIGLICLIAAVITAIFDRRNRP